MAVAAFSAPAQPHSCTQPSSAKEFRPWSAKVWNQDNWARKKPKSTTLKSERHQLACAGPANKTVIKKIWLEDKRAFYKHRRQMIWLETYKPYVYPSGKRWAVPYPIATCESNENYYVGPSGAYGEIPPYPQWQSPRAQDEIAHQLMVEGKEYSAWVEWEGSCAYR